MDDPALDPQAHRRALRGLARINALSGASAALWRPLQGVEAAGTGPLTILDVASGSGDVLARLAARDVRRGARLQFTACDVSRTALDLVRRRSPRIETIQRNVIEQGLPGEYDVVMCSLFLHHLREEAILELLVRMRESARRAVLVCDLRRTRFGLALARTIPRLMTRSTVVHEDAVLSARAALTLHEIRDLAERASMRHASITRRFPSRWLLDWRPGAAR